MRKAVVFVLALVSLTLVGCQSEEQFREKQREVYAKAEAKVVASRLQELFHTLPGYPGEVVAIRGSEAKLLFQYRQRVYDQRDSVAALTIESDYIARTKGGSFFTFRHSLTTDGLLGQDCLVKYVCASAIEKVSIVTEDRAKELFLTTFQHPWPGYRAIFDGPVPFRDL